MSYTGNYRWDIFVSYSMRDNLGEPGWISEFVNGLRRVIESYLGEEITVYFDRRDAHSAGRLEQISQTTDVSAMMLVVLSPAYSKSPGALAELGAFTSDNADRVFVVECLPLAGNDPGPEPLRNHLRMPMWQMLPGSGAAKPLSSAGEVYYSRLHELGFQIRNQLRAIRAGPKQDALRDEPPEPPVLLQGEGLAKPRIFVSYSSKDRDRIRPLAERLEQEGLDPWWDPHIEIGTSFRKVIADELEKADFVLVAWSRYSIESDWVYDEAEFGKRKGILIPVLIDQVEPPVGFRSYQTLDISSWIEAGEGGAIEPLVRRLASLRRAGTNS